MSVPNGRKKKRERASKRERKRENCNETGKSYQWWFIVQPKTEEVNEEDNEEEEEETLFTEDMTSVDKVSDDATCCAVCRTFFMSNADLRQHVIEEHTEEYSFRYPV